MKTKKDHNAEPEGLGLVAPAENENAATLAPYDPRPERVFTAGLALLAGGFTDWPNLRDRAEFAVDALTEPLAAAAPDAPADPEPVDVDESLGS